MLSILSFVFPGKILCFISLSSGIESGINTHDILVSQHSKESIHKSTKSLPDYLAKLSFKKKKKVKKKYEKNST